MNTLMTPLADLVGPACHQTCAVTESAHYFTEPEAGETSALSGALGARRDTAEKRGRVEGRRALKDRPDGKGNTLSTQSLSAPNGALSYTL